VESSRFQTRQPGLAMALWACIWKVRLSNLGWDTGYPEVFPFFPQSLQVNAGDYLD
jgi:hypothetical protein